MKLVILGAGASYDHINFYHENLERFEWRPPLANEIFDSRPRFREIIRRYPGAQALVSEAANVSDLELYFQSKWDFVNTHRADELLRKLINTQYFLADLFSQISVANSDAGNSNYEVLMQWAYEYAIRKKEPVLFVTFNYDLLLELAFMKTFGFTGERKLMQMKDYISFPVKIFKMHGSCNWGRQFSNDISMHYINKRFSEVVYAGNWNYAWLNKYLSENIYVVDQEWHASGKERNYFPSLLLPYRSKDEFMLPPEHLQTLVEHLPEVTEILIVGWKGTEDKFNALLKEHCGNTVRKIQAIVAGDTTIRAVMKKIFPLADLSNYSASAIIDRKDSTVVHPEKVKSVVTSPDALSTYTQRMRESHRQNYRTVNHAAGSFSAYIYNNTFKQEPHFFSE